MSFPKKVTMRHLFLPSAITLALALSACGGSNSGTALPQQSTLTTSAQRTLRAPLGSKSILPETSATTTQAGLCTKPADAAHAGCFATIRTDSVISSIFPDSVWGLTPRDLSSLYAYPAPGWQGTAGAGQTIAVVVAGDYELAESDLGVYRSHFSLPPCTTANGCFKKVGAAATGQTAQTGSSASVSAHPTTATAIGWAGETDTDTQMVSAVCPNCKIIVAEAASDSMTDLGMAVEAAIAANASIINVSFGATESSSDVAWSSQYNGMKHVKLVAAAGDWGYGVYYPASDPSAIAVGGTSLSSSGSTISETAWAGTGSGCSAYFSNPGWQHPPSVTGTCTRRNVVDVSAVADPLTGVAIYDSSLFGIVGGWSIFGGTSVSAPIIAGMNALAANTARGQGAQLLYSAASSAFLPVTSGSNGTCSPQYLCTALTGYNGPTGLGIPQGLGGF
jgi:subtilase family serine protease